MPCDSELVPEYLARRLGDAFDRFLLGAGENPYAQAEGERWQLSKDETHHPNPARLKSLRDWLRARVRRIKLPDLLIADK